MDIAPNAEGSLPLVGTIPDMTATTDVYVALQQIYQSEAVKDRIRFKEILVKLLQVNAQFKRP